MERNKVITSLGTIFVTPTDGKHIFVCANDREPSDIVVNNVSMRFNAHFYLWADGEWHIGEESKQPYERRQMLHLSKVNRRNYNDEPSESARKKLESVLTVVVNSWVKSNAVVIRQADVEDTKTTIARIEKQITDKQQEILNLLRERDGLMDALKQLQ